MNSVAKKLVKFRNVYSRRQLVLIYIFVLCHIVGYLEEHFIASMTQYGRRFKANVHLIKFC